VTTVPSDLLALAARDSLASYCILSFPGFELAPHLRVLIDKLEAVERGEITRLMVFMPPRHGKSFVTSQRFPAWFLGKHPNRFVISASYGQELADDFGRAVRDLVADAQQKAIFPDCQLSGDSGSMHRFNTTSGGSYFAVGRGAAITGRGAHLLLIDDPLKDSQEARSDAVRRELQSWYSNVAYTRLQPQAAIVIIQTRWHTDDLAGWLLREHFEERWEVINMPALAEEDESFRKTGEALWPSRYSLDSLETIRRAVGGAAWQSLYQQRPVAAAGAIFKRDWWKSYTDPPHFNFVLQSWDTAFKTGTENDYSVGTTWGRAENGYYLLDLWRGRVEFPELKRQVEILASKHKPNIIIVEDKASGQSLVQEFQRMTTLPVVPRKVDGDKTARATAVTPIVEAGKVYLPEKATWLADFMDEISSFDAGVHDDQVDSVTLALDYFRKCEPGGIWFFYKQAAEQADRDKADGSLAPKPQQVREGGPAAVEKTVTRVVYGLGS
jgi:predicted phage terminase large subunit-like protein